MDQGTPEIPGLGTDPNEPRLTPEAPPPEYATGLQAPEAAPGAIKWLPFPLPGTVPAGGVRVRMVAGMYSVVGPYDGTFVGAGALRAEIEDKGITPIPPALPKIDDVTLGATVVVAGGEVMGEVDLTLPSPPGGTTVYLISSNSGAAQVLPSITVPYGQLSAPFKVTTNPTLTAGATVTITASANSSSDSATFAVQPKAPEPIPIPPTPTPGPSPLPITRTIDLTGKTQAQIQAAISSAQPGDGLYLGPGVYNLPASVGGDGQSLDVLLKQGITIFGAGPATILDCGGTEGIWLRQGGNINQGNVIRNLLIRNCRRAIAALDPQRLWLQDLWISGCLYGYSSERTSAYDSAHYKWPVTIERVAVNGWTSHAIALKGGETVRRCQLIDTPGNQTPDNQGSTYSHGMYLQGCTSVLIEDVEIANVSGHAFQLYSDQASHEANGALDVTMRRIVCRNNWTGPIIAANGTYDRITIEDMSVLGTVSRNSGTFVISATNSPILNFQMRNIVLDGGGEGLVLQGGQTGYIQGMVIEGLTVRGHNTGIVVGPADWPYTKITSSQIKNYQAPGVPLPVRGTSPGLVIT